MNLVKFIDGTLKGGYVLGELENHHINSVVDTIIDNGRNYMVMGGVGTLAAITLITSGCGGYSKEDMQRYAQQYATEQQQKAAQLQKAQADEAQLKRNIADIEYVTKQLGENKKEIGEVKTQLKENITKIGDLDKKIDAQTGVLDKKITDQTEVLKKSIDDALKQYLDNQQDTFYRPPPVYVKPIPRSWYVPPPVIIPRPRYVPPPVYVPPPRSIPIPPPRDWRHRR